ncbi:MAG: hypothetical protein DMF88_23135 [Acidobacteria bacterium]|nr:MAG: hypothetical protein DMF88_23135 [Acidobacteriota bacterium]
MLAAAIGCGAASPSLAQQPAAEALVDHHFTVGAGASISATIGTLVARGEDRAVPQRLFAEEGASRRTANVGYRIFKHIFFDAPQDDRVRLSSALAVRRRRRGDCVRVRSRADAV